MSQENKRKDPLIAASLAGSILGSEPLAGAADSYSLMGSAFGNALSHAGKQSGKYIPGNQIGLSEEDEKKNAEIDAKNAARKAARKAAKKGQ